MGTIINIDNLSSTELVSGLLVNVKANKFSDQMLYRFLRKLESDMPALRERFRIEGSDDRLRSEPIQKILDFLEMGKILEVAMPNPVHQFYRPRPMQLPALRRQLEARGVLPTHEDAFIELASEFDALISESQESR
jgi:hypothetical protein